MSTIKALDKLREALADCIMEAGHTDKFDTYWIVKDAADKLLDEVETEIEERYTLLPLDADGVPIRVRDELECHANGYDGAFTVFAIGNDVVVGDYDIEWVARNPTNWFHVASFCTHAKPRTLEDVLADFVNSSVRVGCEDGISSEMRLYADGAAIAKCAEEIRAMFGEVDR